MNAWFDPKWIINTLGMPLSHLALFPIGTILAFFVASKLRLSSDATLLEKQKPQFIVTKFTFGFIIGGLVLIAILAIIEKQFALTISPLPQFIGIDNLL